MFVTTKDETGGKNRPKYCKKIYKLKSLLCTLKYFLCIFGLEFIIKIILVRHKVI